MGCMTEEAYLEWIIECNRVSDDAEQFDAWFFSKLFYLVIYKIRTYLYIACITLNIISDPFDPQLSVLEQNCVV